MPPSSSLLALTDIISALDRAVTNSKGVRVFCGSHGDAINLRQRAYRAREIDRNENRKIYSPDDPAYGRSVYDRLLMIPRVAEDGDWFLYIEVSTPKRLADLMEDIE